MKLRGYPTDLCIFLFLFGKLHVHWLLQGHILQNPGDQSRPLVYATLPFFDKVVLCLFISPKSQKTIVLTTVLCSMSEKTPQKGVIVTTFSRLGIYLEFEFLCFPSGVHFIYQWYYVLVERWLSCLTLWSVMSDLPKLSRCLSRCKLDDRYAAPCEMGLF